MLLTANPVSKLGSFSHIPLRLLLPLLPQIRFDFLNATGGRGKDSNPLLLEAPQLSLQA